MRRATKSVVAALLVLLAIAPVLAQQLITVKSQSPLIELKAMVKAGSSSDPASREGLANLTARMLLEGSFGDPKAPVTKEKLAEITRPWGDGALPRVQVDKDATTFSATVPRAVFTEFVNKVWEPMFTRPLFAAAELDRVRKEAAVFVTSELRFENAERLGVEVLDETLLGRGYAHPVEGTSRGLQAITRDDVVSFYGRFYRPANVAVSLATDDAAAGEGARRALARIGSPSTASPLGRTPPQPQDGAPRDHSVLIVTQPGAIATGIHAGYSWTLTRTDADYWPLFVANVFFGTHRDSFGRLYNDIREDRGYNYGDYSYLEFVEGRWRYLFPPPNTPRARQYFSVWIRPVGHQYAHHIMKALTWEIDNFIRTGMTAGEVKQSKDKAKILYLNLAETTDRLAGYRLDDWFYGMTARGYLDTFLAHIDAVTPEQVNAAIRKHLRTADLQYVVVTDEATAEKLRADLPSGRNAAGKSPAEYQIEATEKDGTKVWLIPEKKLDVLRLDKVWELYPLNVPAANIRVVPARQLFE